MSINMKILAFLGGLYLLAGIATFGHAAAATKKREQAEFALCAPDDTTFACLADNSGETAVITGMLAGIAWPLYVSWEVYS